MRLPDKLQKGLSIRGDAIYCPLSFGLDTYSNCSYNCTYCFCRGLNYVWDKTFRPLDVHLFKKQILSGLKNNSPKTPLAWAIKQKKTLRLGSKADPFPREERDQRITYEVLKFLKELNWSIKIETKNTNILLDYKDLVIDMKAIITISLSCGLEKDWKIFEYEGNTGIPSPKIRLEEAQIFQKAGLQVGFIGEPFIPGFHTPDDFERTVKLLKSYGFSRYNTYNMHLTPFVAKRLHAIGIDVQRIWYYNRDEQWKPILQQLLDLGKKYDIVLGCPDHVNAGIGYVQRANTCCGVNVPNPTMFNTFTWIKLIQEGKNLEEIFEFTWDGIGDKEQGRKVLFEDSDKFYTINDARTKINL